MNQRNCTWVLAGTCLAALATHGACAESTGESIPTVKLTLYPAAEPVPALKYQLLPPMIERRRGNAAVIYGKVTAEQNAFFANQKLQENINQWLEVPFHEFPKDQVRKEFHPPLYFLRMAARCESADWDEPIREENLYTILLPEVQQTRTFGRALALQARLHIAYREYEPAVEMFQTGYALARHVAEQPLLISNLVGVAIHSIMLGPLMEWVQQPDSPNLYWALSVLPRPIVDFRRAMETETYGIYLSFPELRDLDKKDCPPGYWQYVLDKLVGEMAKMTGQGPRPELQRAWTAVVLLQGYPKAKQWLIDHGRQADDVEKMPVAQVVLLYTMQTFDELRDDSCKWVLLPYPEARKGLQSADARLRDALRDREIIPLASTLLPAVSAVKNAEVRAQREIAVLRVLEALRWYAAKHDRLPDSLRDITEIPLPDDPVRSEPFPYQAHNRVSAVMDVLGSPGAWGGYPHGVRYEIELKK